MKKFKYIIGLGVVILLTTLTTVSCTDGNDWDVDSSYDRLFSVLGSSISLSADVNTAELKWTKTPGTEYYIIEVSQDTLYNDVAMGSNGSMVYGEDKTITSSPFVITGLEDNTKYFLRVKAMSSAKPESEWSYPSENKSFNTKAEQIFYALGDEDLEETRVTLRWPKGEMATTIVVNPGSITHPVTSTEVSNGTVTIEGLVSETKYTAVLMNGSKVRGTLTFVTPLDLGDAIQVFPTDNLSELIANANDNDVFALMPGEYAVSKLSIIKNISIKAAKSLNKPVLKTIISMEAGVSLELKDVILDGAGIGKDGVNGDQAIQFNTAGVDYGDISIVGCEIKNYLKGLLYLNVAAVANSVTIDNCILSNIECNGGDFFDCRAGTPKTVTFTNNTVYKSVGARDLFRIDDKSSAFAGVAPTVLISNNTLVGVSNISTYRLLYIRWKNNSVTLTNNIITNTVGALKHNSTNLTSSDRNNYFDASTMSGADTGNKTTFDPEFKNAANGDFTVGNSSVRVGDPRWIQ
ncbi:MAG: DUF4957 domain-containing protein [Dysgonomonas sp.]|nr:DUF4957 domain-containing protein [Dysgonomonas sp.]